MPKVSRIKRIHSALAKLRKKAAESNRTVQVGYTQDYALFVHEVQAKHAEGKEWKYLESPARRLRTELATIIETIYKKTRSLAKGLLVAGLRLQRESQLIVPIDTSALKASAYTAYEEEADAAATAAFAKSEAVKTREQTKRNKAKLKKRIRSLKGDMKKASRRRKK